MESDTVSKKVESIHLNLDGKTFSSPNTSFNFTPLDNLGRLGILSSLSFVLSSTKSLSHFRYKYADTLFILQLRVNWSFLL